jgi:hypothetical protein
VKLSVAEVLSWLLLLDAGSCRYFVRAVAERGSESCSLNRTTLLAASSRQAQLQPKKMIISCFRPNLPNPDISNLSKIWVIEKYKIFIVERTLSIQLDTDSSLSL